ncbi:MAG: DUF4286 family protein [Cyclobacteriaceae bacterium]|nr:DUF4286 family protein [Cyclobacteriaceae bacterium]
MILYNVTVGIDQDIEQEWLHWMLSEYIPRVMDTGFFVRYKIFKVISEESEDSVSYSIQYFADTLDHVVRYLNEDGPALVELHRQRYLNKHLAFRTLLEEVV